MLKVQIQAVKAICSFVLHNEKAIEVLKQFIDLLPDMMIVRFYIDLIDYKDKQKLLYLLFCSNNR